MFRNREDAALQLARQLAPRRLKRPLVLAIPRGGVVTGAVLARELGAELDVVLARKLRAPFQPELALGAVGEDGEVYLSEFARQETGASEDYLQRERERQLGEIERRKALFRAIRPKADARGRSVIITDDGIATGSTMMAALHVLKHERPFELIVAVPVGPPEKLAALRKECDAVEYLLAPPSFTAISPFYAEFEQVEEEEALNLLAESRKAPRHARSENG